jgi:hypothetical protein
VTSVAGHVYNRDFTLQYQDRRSNPISLFDAPTVRKLDKQSRVVAKHLQAVSRASTTSFYGWIAIKRERTIALRSWISADSTSLTVRGKEFSVPNSPQSPKRTFRLLSMASSLNPITMKVSRWMQDKSWTSR